MAELQERIRQLEEENTSRNENLLKENERLKEQLKKLQEENYALKGTPFTFEFPPKPESSPNANDAKNPSPNSYRSTSHSSRSSADDSAHTREGDSSNHGITSCSSSSSGSEHNSPEPDLSLPDQQIIFGPLSTQPHQSSEQLPQQQQQQQQNQDQAPFYQQSIDPYTLFGSLSSLPSGDGLDFLNGLSAPEIKSNDAIFTDYRVPASSDNFLFQNDTLPPLFGTDVDLFGLNVPAPFSADLEPSAPLAGDDEAQRQQMVMATLMQAKGQSRRCQELERDVQKHCPDFNLDSLCDDLKKKATCSESVFTDHEVDQLIHCVENKYNKKQPSAF